MKHEMNFKNLKQQLGLYSAEDDILRCKGRLGNALLDIAARYPILLPRRHHVTRLIVEACHRKVNHGGVKETLVELGSEYWAPKGRQLVKKTLHQCVVCKKLEGLPYKAYKKRGTTRNKGHRCTCVHARGSGFRRPVIYEDHQRYRQNIRLPIYMCNVKSDTPGTSPRLIPTSVHQRPSTISWKTRDTSLHNVRQRQNVQASQERPRPAIQRQESPRFCRQPRHHLELHSRESAVVGRML